MWLLAYSSLLLLLLLQVPDPLPDNDRGFVPALGKGTLAGKKNPPGFPTLKTMSVSSCTKLLAWLSANGATSHSNAPWCIVCTMRVAHCLPLCVLPFGCRAAARIASTLMCAWHSTWARRITGHRLLAVLKNFRVGLRFAPHQ